MASSSYPRSEGMVAIIKGLKDAGLSITVSAAQALDSTYRRGSAMQASPMRSQGQMGTVSSAVQTSSPPARSRSTTGVHRKSPYVSTYQLAYGSRGVSQSPPMSPARGSTTFDIQHLNDQLNELRASLYGPRMNMVPPVQSPSAPNHTRMTEPARPRRVTPVRDEPCYRSSVDLDRPRASSSFNTRRDLRVSDAFVESLRKYPSSADRTASADLIQRLLAYTQSKNSARKEGKGMTVRPKRVHSLTRHSRTSSHMVKSSNKNIQTYTRTRNESPSPAAVYGKPDRRKRVTSPAAKSERSEGSATGHDATSYDYLKIGSFARNPDVRYLNDVSRYVRDTLRLICNNDEVACPRMLDRYSAHRREHHSSEAATLTVREINEFAETSGPKPRSPKRVCRFGDPYTDSCKVKPRSMNDTIRMKMSEIKEKLCIICNQPTPCNCDHPPCPCPENRPIKFKDRVKSLDICEEFRRFCTQEPFHESCSCPQEVDELIDKVVDDWVKQIPIYASYTFKEKAARDQIVSELKNNLKRHVGDPSKCKEDAISCLKFLPMWLPPDKNDHNSFKEKLIDVLLKQTANIDIFTEKVRKWVQTLPFLSDAKLDKDKIVANVSKKMKDTAMTTNNLKNDIKYDAYEILQKLPIKNCTCLETDQLAENISQSIASLPPEVIDGLKYSSEFSYVRKQVEFADKVWRWVNKIPFEPSASVDREAVTQEFVEELSDIMKKTEPGSLWDSVKRYVQKILHKMPVQGGYGEVAHQAAKLADELTSDMFAEVVSNWAKTIAFDYDSNVDPDIFAHDMTKQLTAAIKDLEPEEVEETFRNFIFDVLNDVPASGSIPLKVSQAGRLANALSKLGRKDAGKIKETIKHWLKEVPFEVDTDSPVDKAKVVNNLAHKISEKVEATRPEEIWSEIKKVTIDEMVGLPVVNSSVNIEQLARKLADNLVALLFGDAVTDWAKSVPFKTGAIDFDGFSTDLCKKLKDAVMYEDPEIFEKLVRDIALESLPDDLLMCSPEEKDKLVEDLVDTMNNTANKRDKIAAIVGNWYKKVPLLTPVPQDQVKDFVKKLKLKLTKTNPRELWVALKQAAIEELEHSHTDCLSTDMDTLAKNLANMLAPEEFEEIIKDWAESIPFDRKTNESVDNFTKYIAKKLKAAISGRNIDEVHDNLRNIIIEELNIAEIILDEPKKAEEAERLIHKLKKIYPDRDDILIIIENWMKTIPFKPQMSQFVNKIKITKELAKTLTEKIKTIQDPEDTWFELSEVTQERLNKMPIDTSALTIQRLGDQLADMLVTYLLSNTIQNCIKLPYFDTNNSINNKELVNNLTKKIDKIAVPKSRQKHQEILKDMIAERLHHEPLMCTTDQLDEIANSIATKITSLPRKPDNFSKTLHNWVKTIPFLSRPPEDNYKFATGLRNKLRNVVENEPSGKIKDAMISDTIGFLEKYDLKCNKEEKLKLAENLVNQLVNSLYIDTVFNWLKNIPPKSNTPIDKATLSNKFVEKLNPLLSNDNPDKKALVKLVNEELTLLQLDTGPGDIEQNLINKLLKLPKENLRQTFAINIKDWLKGVTVTLGAEDNEALVKNTLDKLRTLRSQGKDEAKIREELKQDIKDYIDKVYEGQNPEARRNLVNKTFKQVFDTFKVIGQERKQALLPKFIESIMNWWAENKELAKLDQKIKDKITTDLASKLAEDAIGGGGNQTLIKSKIIKIISNTLDTIDTKLKDQPDMKNKLLKSLSDKIAADIGILSTRQIAKENTETQFRVEAMHKVKSAISAVETIIRNQSLTHRISDLNTQEKRISNRERSMITNNLDESKNIAFQNKRTLIDDILRGLETEANINCLSEEFCGKKDISIENNSLFTEVVREKIAQNITNTLTSLLAQGNNLQNVKSEMASKIEEEIKNISDIGTNVLYKQVDKLIDKLNETIQLIQSNEHVKEWLQEASELLSISPEEQKTSLQKSEDNESIPDYYGTEDLDKIKDTKLINIEINEDESAIHADVSTSSTSDENPTTALENDLMTDIINLLECVPEISSNAAAHMKEIEKVSEALTSKLLVVDLQDFDKKQTQKNLQNEIVELLDDMLEYKGEKFNKKTKLMLANQLLNTLAVYIGALSLIDVNENHIKQAIKRWIQEVFDFASRSSSEKKELEKTAKALVKSIKKIKTKNLDRPESKKKLLAEIKDKLDAAFRCKGKQLGDDTKQKLADKLLERLLGIKTASNCSSFCTAYETQHTFLKTFKKDLEGWAESIPKLPSRKYMENILNSNKITHHLLTSLENLLSEGLHSEYIENEMLSKIKLELDNIYDEHINVHEKNKLVEELLNRLAKRLLQFQLNPSKRNVTVTDQLSGNDSGRSLEKALKNEVTDNLDHKNKRATKKSVNNISDFSKQVSGLKAKINYSKVEQQIPKELVKRTENGNFNTIISDHSLHELIGLKRIDTLSSIHLAESKNIKKYLHNQIVEEPYAANEINKTKREDNYSKINYSVKNIDQNFKRFDKEIEMHNMQGKKLQQPDETVPTKGKKMYAKTRRSLTNLLMDKLDRSTSYVEIFAAKALQNDVKAWFDNIPELQGKNATEKANNKRLLRNLTKNLAHLQSVDKEDFQDKMALKIKRNLYLDSKGKDLTSRSKDKLVEELLGKIFESIENYSTTSFRKIVISTQNAKQMLKELLPEIFLDKLSNERELGKLSKKLTKLFNNLQRSDIENKAIRKNILIQIKDHLDTTFDNIDNYLSLKGTYIIAETLLDVLLESVAKAEKKTDISKVFQKDVLSWLEDIPETASTNAGERKANSKSSLVLAKKLANLYSGGLDNKHMRMEFFDEIRKHLEKVLKERGVIMQSKEINKLVDKLLANILTILSGPVLTSTDNQESIIWEWVDGITMLTQKCMPEKRKKVKELNEVLHKIRTKCVPSNIKKYEMRKEINRWLKGISNRKEKYLDEYTNHNYITKLVENMQSQDPKFETDLISSRQTKGKSKPGCSKDFGVYPDSIGPKKSESLFNTSPSEVFYQLQEAESSQASIHEISREIDENTQAKIIGLITHNIDAMDVPEKMEMLRIQIMKILMVEAKLPENEAKSLTKAILQNAYEQSQYAEADEKHLLMLLRQEIIRIMDEYPIAEDNRDEVEAFLMDLEVRRLFEGESYEDADKEILKLIQEKGGLSLDDSIKMTSQLGGDYEHIMASLNKEKDTLKTSTPKKSSIKAKREEEERELGKSKNNVTRFRRTSEVDRFKNGLGDVIENWLDNLPIDKETLEDKTYKDAIIEELCENMLDRENYLQECPNMTVSEDEEREYRKDQCKTWLEKFLDNEDLDTARARIDDLISGIKAIAVPKFTDNKSLKLDIVPTYCDALQDEIMTWVSELPPHLQPKIDDDTLRKHIKDMVNRIEKDKNEPDAENKIRADIANMLPLIFEDVDEADLKGLGSALFKSLMKRGFTDDTWTPPKPSSQHNKSGKSGEVPTYHDALQDEIMTWVAGLPPHLQPKVDDDALTKYLKDLANRIGKHKGKPDAEDKIRADIANMLPLIFEDVDEADLKGLGSALFKNLMKIGFTDNTWTPPKPSSQHNKSGKSGEVPTYHDALQDEIMTWVAGLPPHLQPKVDYDTLTQYLKDLASRIGKHKGKPDAEEKIRADIGNMLPLIFEDVDEADLKGLGSALFKNLMKRGFTDNTWTPPKPSSQHNKSGKSGEVPTYHDALQDEIMTWVAGLPPHLQPKVDDDTLTKYLKDLANRIGKHKGKPDAEDKIRADIANMLPLIFEDVDEADLKGLGSALFKNLMKRGFTDNTWTPPKPSSQQNKSGKSGEVPTYHDSLQDEIMTWVAGLPPHLQPKVDYDTLTQYLKDLASRIGKHKGKPDAEEKIRADIGNMLPLIFEDVDEADLKGLGSALFKNLMKRGFTDNTWTPPKPSSQHNKSGKSGEVPTYHDALQDEIMTWVAGLPPHLQPKVDDDTLTKYLKDLANRIGKHKGKSDAEDKIRADIANMLPLIFEDVDEADLKGLGSALFKSLMKRGFTDDTWTPPKPSSQHNKSGKSGEVPTYHDALQDEIMTWVAGLPPHLQPKVDDDTLTKYLKDLANRIGKHKGKPDAEDKIRADIANMLPLIFEDVDEADLKGLGSALFKNLMKRGFTDNTWTPPKPSSQHNKSGKSGEVPTYHDALQDEIMTWVAGLPPHLQPKVDDDTLTKYLKDLANRIGKHKGKSDAEDKIRADIAFMLPLIFEDVDEADLKGLGSALFKSLMKRGFTDDTWTPPKPSSQHNKSGKSGEVPTYHDALQDEIMTWVAGLPPHLQPKVDDDTLTKYLKDLANRIGKHKGKPDAEDKIRADIANMLPLIFEDVDEADLKGLGSALFKSLMKRGFTDDTWTPPKPSSQHNKSGKSGEVPTYHDALQDEIMTWVAGLPPHLQPKVDDDTLTKYLKDLANRIGKHKGKPDAEDKIRADIANMLPLIFEDVDEADLKGLGSALFKNLMKRGFIDNTWTPTKPSSQYNKSGKSGEVPTYHDALQDEIMTWVAGLPPHLQPKVDDDTLTKYLKDLANRIGKHKGKSDAEDKIRADIANMLPLIFEDVDEADLKGLGSALFKSLMKRGFTDDTWTPSKPSSQHNKSGKSGEVPTYHDALQDEIMTWVAGLPPYLQPKVDDDTLTKYLKDLANRIGKHKGKSDAEDKIRADIANMLPLIFEDVDEADLKGLGSALFKSLMKRGFTDDTWTPPKPSKDLAKKGFTDDTWVPPIRQCSEFVEHNLIGAVQEWLKQTPMYQKASPEDKRQMELAAMDMGKGIKRTVSIAKLTPGADMDELVREQIMKDLKNIIRDPKFKNDEDFLNKTADNVTNYLNAQKMYQDLTGKPAEVLPDLLGLAVDDWTRKLPIDIKTPQEQERFNEAKKNFVKRLKQARSQFHPSSPEHKQAIRDEARKFSRANITDPNKKFDDKYIEEMVNKLEKAIHIVPIESVDTTSNNIEPYRSPADTLYEYIEDWVKNLPVQGEPEKVNLIKQSLTSKLVNKIGELNINPEIFNDAALYQDLLQDEIDKLLTEIPANPELNKYLPALKKDLISKIMDARQKMLEELAGIFYKQHLRDKISTSLPLPSCLTIDEQASLELLKDKVADAFINLRYASCNESENQRYKSKIFNELNKFVNDIFRHYPCAHLDSDKLKNDLHTALTRVPVPRDDSMKSEVEQVRIRDLIYDWMREIPLRQETATEKLHRYKLAAVLAKRLHDIEMEKQSNDFIDSEYKISEEITRFLNKILLRQGQKSAIPDLVQKLVDSLKYTEQSRRFISSSRRCQPNDTSAESCSRYPSSLSPEDQDHLRRIKIRRGPTCSKDVGLCPSLSDSCNQTDTIGENWIEQRSPGVKTVSSPKYCAAIPQTKDVSCMTPRESPCHIQPRVIVKEYIWDSPDNCSQSKAQGIQTTPPDLAATERSSCRFPVSLDRPGPSNSFPTPLEELANPCAPNPSISPHSICTRRSPNNVNPYPAPHKQYSEQPPMTKRLSQNPCYCPPYQERELRSHQEFQKRRLTADEDELSSEDEYISMGQPGPSRNYRRMPEYRRLSPECEDMKKRTGGSRFPRHRWTGRFGDDEELYNPCVRHRMRREGFRPMGKGSKCNCKERILVSCKGYGNRFADMCQACGNTCPHPRPLFFK